MRKMILWAVTSLLCMSATMASATSKEEMKCNYVVKNLHLNKEKAAAFRTVCLEYIKEHKAANDAYDNLKDKLKSKMKNGSLTESEANQLLNAHWRSEEHTSELSHQIISYAVFCLKKKNASADGTRPGMRMLPRNTRNWCASLD